MPPHTPHQPYHDTYPTVVIVGNVNVGKSTLFNRFVEHNRALISRVPGTTRTSNEDIAEWRTTSFRVIDTGGLTFDTTKPFETEIMQQVQKATEKADLIIFMIDITHALGIEEKKLAAIVRKKKKSVLLVANKADTNAHAALKDDPQWRQLGLGTPFPISASTGKRVGDLLDAIITHHAFLERITSPAPVKKNNEIKIAIVGKPNTGKSSLYNALINEDVAIVSHIPHTTREAHDTVITWQDTQFRFIDTAGIRKKAKINDALENAGVRQAIGQIKEADVVAFVIDASVPVSHQDRALAGLIETHNKPNVIIANKWDVINKELSEELHVRHTVSKRITREELFRAYLSRHFAFVDFAPILFVSAKTKKNVHDIFPLLARVAEARLIHIDPHALERALHEITHAHQPTRGKGVRHPRIFSLKQIATAPPVFQVSVKRKTDLHASYIRYLERKLREHFGFEGVPLVFYVKKVSR